MSEHNSDTYYNHKAKRPYFHWVERAQKGQLASISIKIPFFAQSSFFKKFSPGKAKTLLLIKGPQLSPNESVMKSQIYDLAEGKRFVPEQAKIRELARMVHFNLVNENAISMSDMTQMEFSPALPREINPLFIERKFEYRNEKNNQRLISFLQCLGIENPGQNEFLLAYVITELIEAVITFRDKFPEVKIYLEVPSAEPSEESISVVEIEDWQIFPVQETAYKFHSIPETNQPYLGRFELVEQSEESHATDEIMTFGSSFYHTATKKLDLVPTKTVKTATSSSGTQLDRPALEGHYQIYRSFMNLNQSNVQIFDHMVSPYRYGISLENHRDQEIAYSTLSFWTEFEYEGKSYRVHNFSSHLHDLVKFLAQGIGYFSEKDRKELAFFKKGLKRDNDLKILKHQGVAALILLECSRYILGQPLSSGEVIEANQDQDFLVVLEKNIYQLFKNTISMDRYAEQTQDQLTSLKDFLSDRVYVFFINSCEVVLRIIKMGHRYLCVGDKIVEVGMENHFLSEVILALIEPIFIMSRGDVISKGQSKYFDSLVRWTAHSDLLDDSERFAEPLFEGAAIEAELKNQYVQKISVSDATLPFLYAKIAELARKDWRVMIDAIPLEELGEDDLSSEMTLQNGKTDWFELSPKVFFKGQQIRLEDIKFSGSGKGVGTGVLFYKGRPYLIDPKVLPKFAVLESFWERIKRDELNAGGGREKDFVRVPRSAILELLALADSGTPITSDNPYWNQIYNFYKNLGSDEQRIQLPEHLQQILKDYQVVGTQWINDLYRLHLGGILADDMGLGKTLQALTFLNQHRLEGHKTWSLVVVPTSLCFNWENEARKFTPELDLEIFTTAKKKDIFETKKDQHRVIVVTYGLLSEHEKFFAEQLWDVVIFDEAQNLKNLSSKRTSSARGLKAKFKLALSGTPLENNFLDFFSLTDLVLPGSLGSYKNFIEVFGAGKSIESEDVIMLKKKIKPIVLRRTKGSVNLNLPQKTEESLRLEFDEEQLDIYRKLALSHNDQVSQMIRDFGESKSQLAMLTALLRLRQVCSDPNGVPNIVYKETPPKLSYIVDCLKEHLEEGKSVIIFTQFIATLQHLTRLFEKNNIPFSTIHGSVTAKARGQILDEFQNSDAPQVLLMTLKTGGVGLNLTKASVVYHVEPWWNPAVENQATDRVHRLGQKKDIQVYRLIMKDSVEEKIELLKSKKQKYFDSLFSESEVLSNSDAAVGGYLSVEDFKFLLS